MIAQFFQHASVNNVTGTSSGADIKCDEVDDNDEIVEPSAKVSEAIKGLESALSWLETQEIDYVQMLHVRNVLDFAKSRRETCLKQLKLDAFFFKENKLHHEA